MMDKSALLFKVAKAEKFPQKAEEVMYNKQRTCCLSVEMATFIFGILSAVISGCGVIAFATARTWLGALPGNEDFSEWLHDPSSRHVGLDNDNKKTMLYTAIVIYILFLFVCCLIWFIFSVFLCYGIRQRRPNFVKAYLVFSVVVTILMIINAVFYVSMTNVIFCVLYPPIVLMVKRTYEVIRADPYKKASFA